MVERCRVTWPEIGVNNPHSRPAPTPENKLDALDLLLSRFSEPKMTLNVPRPYNPVWEQNYTEAAHSLGTRHSSSRAIVHNAQFQ